MFHFSGEHKPPPFLNRRVQVRLLMLVALLALVLVAMEIAARPSSWYWMWGGQPPAETRGGASKADRNVVAGRSPDRPARAAGGSGDPPTTASGDGGDVETRRPVAEPLPADVFRVQVAASGERELAEAPEQALADPSLRSSAALLDPDVLAGVEDNSPVRAAESGAYFQVLAAARDADPAELERRARGDLPFAVLFSEPQRHRGELVALEGHARRVVSFPAGPNDAGIETLYEAWLFTDDSGRNPYTVVCTHVPEGMPTGDGLTERVRVAGFFFKRYAYRAADTTRVAPMILAHRLVWLRPPRRDTGFGLAPYIVGFLAAVAVALGAAVWFYAREDRRFWRGRGEKLLSPAPEDFDAIEQREVEPAEEPPGGEEPER